VIDEVVNLARELTTLKLPFANDTFVFGDYDPISVRDNRRYEVWLFPTQTKTIHDRLEAVKSIFSRTK